MSAAPLVSMRWIDQGLNGHLELIDQTALPTDEHFLVMGDVEVLRDAIIRLVVRGAPAIGCAAAYGLAQHCCRAALALPEAAIGTALEPAMVAGHERLVTSRPTAVNLRWALDRLRNCFDRHSDLLTARESAARLLMEAKRIHAEDIQLCRAIGANGGPLLPVAGGILTVCNTGALATGGIGTALGCVRVAFETGATGTVYACETRPLLQGARLTALECLRLGIPVKLCTDGMAGSLMARGMIAAVIAGADRIAANGDSANKIGTYQLAVLAQHHGIPFYIAAPYSTFDLSLPDGSGIIIEERDPVEVTAIRGAPTAPDGCPAVNPAFDVTPAGLITAIITERGVIEAPTTERVATLMADEGEEDVPAV